MKKLLFFVAIIIASMCKAQDKKDVVYKLLLGINGEILKANNEHTLDSIQVVLSKIDTVGVGIFFKNESKRTFDYLEMVRKQLNPKYAKEKKELVKKNHEKKYGKKLGEKIYFIELEPGMTLSMMFDAMDKSYIKKESHTVHKNSAGNWDVYTFKSGSETFYTVTLLNYKIVSFTKTDL